MNGKHVRESAQYTVISITNYSVEKQDGSQMLNNIT